MNQKLILKELEVKEVIRKNVKKSGNGGAVWVPKRWLGEDVVIILPNQTKKSSTKVYNCGGVGKKLA